MKYGHIRNTNRRSNLQAPLAELNSKSPKIIIPVPSQWREEVKEEIIPEALWARLGFKLNTM